MTTKMSHKLKKPSKVVVSGDIKRSGLRLPKLSKKILVIGLACLGGLVFIVLTVALTRSVLNNKDDSVQRMAVCTTKASNNIAVEASRFLPPSQYKQLKVVNDKIQKLPNYEKDPNCLFPIVQYYVYTNDEKNAKLYYNKLVLVYDSKTGFDKYYTAYAKNLDDVKKSIDNVVAYNQQAQKNVKHPQ